MSDVPVIIEHLRPIAVIRLHRPRGLNARNNSLVVLLKTKDTPQGITAFIAESRPVWRGR